MSLTQNGVANLTLNSQAFGGSGGDSANTTGGIGGTASATGSLSASGNMTVIAAANSDQFNNNIASHGSDITSGTFGTGGNGNNGTAIATGIGTGTNAGHSAVTVIANAYGQIGGFVTGANGNGGNGGNGISQATGTTAGPDVISVVSHATGGAGSQGSGLGFHGGTGGGGNATATATSTAGQAIATAIASTGTFGAGSNSASTGGLGIANATSTANSITNAKADSTGTGISGSVTSNGKANATGTPVAFALEVLRPRRSIAWPIPKPAGICRQRHAQLFHQQHVRQQRLCHTVSSQRLGDQSLEWSDERHQRIRWKRRQRADDRPGEHAASECDGRLIAHLQHRARPQ